MAVLAFAAPGLARQMSASAPPFQIVQSATSDPKKFMADWEKPGELARLETQSSARRGATLHTFIVFRGCKADAAGACQVTADYQVLSPTGSVYADVKGAEIWRNRPAPPANTFFLSVSGLALRFEAQDPLGPYTVKATVVDQVAGVTLRTQQVLTAVAD